MCRRHSEPAFLNISESITKTLYHIYMNLKTIVKPLAWITLTLALSAYLERHGHARVEPGKDKAEKNTIAANASLRN